MGTRNQLRAVLYALSLLIVPACVEPHEGEGADSEDLSSNGSPELGVVQLALTEVPANVMCLRVTIQNGGVTRRLIDVSGGQTSDEFLLTDLPVGPATLLAEAFDVTCDQVGPSTPPSWVSDPVEGVISCIPPLSVTFIMHKRGQAEVGFDFQCDCETPEPLLALITQGSRTLVLVRPSKPGTVVRTIELPLPSTESIIAIDKRPATGEVFLLSTGHQLYRLDPNDSPVELVPVGDPITQVFGDFVGFDFNPVVDRIRVTGQLGENLRVNPNTGAVIVDEPIDTTDRVLALAYSNNTSTAAATTLYGIDFDTDSVVTVGGINGSPSPNGGLVFPVGPLGFFTPGGIAFDIAAPPSGRAFSAFIPFPPDGSAPGTTPQLYAIDVTTGAATLLGALPLTGGIRGLTAL